MSFQAKSALRAAICAATLLTAAPAWAATHCCAVVSVDTRSGNVSAQDKATQRRFEFKVENAILLRRIQPGQAVAADFAAGKATVEGIAGQYNIVAAAAGAAPAQPAPVTAAPGVAPVQPAAPPAQPAPAGVIGAAPPPAPRPPAAGVIGAAPSPAPSLTRPPTAPAIGAAPSPLQLGQRPPAAPAVGGAPLLAQQPQPAAPVGAAPRATAAGPAAAATGGLSAQTAAGVGRTAGSAYPLPSITAGAPVMASATSGRQAQRASLRGSGIHLRGLDEIDSNTALPESAKILLMMHVGTLPENASDHYIVNPQLAREWAQARGMDVPASMKPTKKKKKKKKCDWTHSGGCADKVQQTAQDIWDAASEDWKRAWAANTKNLAEKWNETQDCFKDHRLPLADIPVKFSVEPEFPVNLEKSDSRGGQSGSASGSAKGTLTVGLPVQADFRAQVELFYIPCLPFAIRPRSVGADGSMTVAARVGANVVATGNFAADYTIPPGGGPAIPIAVIPIVVAGVPVAILDVSLYVDGSVRVGGEGQLDGKFQLTAPYRSDFDFECNGHRCSGKMKNKPVPVTTTENVVLKGSVHVQPAIYTALQLSLNFEALAARAGPQPFLYGEVRGCSATAAAQNSAGQSSAQEFHALTADLDWGIEFRAEGLVAGEQVAAYVDEVMKRRHIAFNDIAPGGSTALAPGLSGPVQLAPASPGAFILKSRPCHPFADVVEYRLAWTGNAAPPTSSAAAPARIPVGQGGRVGPAPPPASPACTWGSGQATCKLKPGADAAFTLVWPQAGAYTLTATPVRDAHERVFRADRATQMNINVQ